MANLSDLGNIQFELPPQFNPAAGASTFVIPDINGLQVPLLNGAPGSASANGAHGQALPRSPTTQTLTPRSTTRKVIRQANPPQLQKLLGTTDSTWLTTRRRLRRTIKDSITFLSSQKAELGNLIRYVKAQQRDTHEETIKRLKEFDEQLSAVIQECERLAVCFNRDRITIGFVGREKQGKSSFLSSWLTEKMKEDAIPPSAVERCTAAPTRLHSKPQGSGGPNYQAIVTFHSRRSFLDYVNSLLLALGQVPVSLDKEGFNPPKVDFSQVNEMTELTTEQYNAREDLKQVCNEITWGIIRGTCVHDDDFHYFADGLSGDTGEGLAGALAPYINFSSKSPERYAVYQIDIVAPFPGMESEPFEIIDLPGVNAPSQVIGDMTYDYIDEMLDIIVLVKDPLQPDVQSNESRIIFRSVAKNPERLFAIVPYMDYYTSLEPKSSNHPPMFRWEVCIESIRQHISEASGGIFTPVDNIFPVSNYWQCEKPTVDVVKNVLPRRFDAQGYNEMINRASKYRPNPARDLSGFEAFTSHLSKWVREDLNEIETKECAAVVTAARSISKSINDFLGALEMYREDKLDELQPQLLFDEASGPSVAVRALGEAPTLEKLFLEKAASTAINPLETPQKVPSSGSSSQSASAPIMMIDAHGNKVRRQFDTELVVKKMCTVVKNMKPQIDERIDGTYRAFCGTYGAFFPSQVEKAVRFGLYTAINKMIQEEFKPVFEKYFSDWVDLIQKTIIKAEFIHGGSILALYPPTDPPFSKSICKELDELFTAAKKQSLSNMVIRAVQIFSNLSLGTVGLDLSSENPRKIGEFYKALGTKPDDYQELLVLPFPPGEAVARSPGPSDARIKSDCDKLKGRLRRVADLVSNMFETAVGKDPEFKTLVQDLLLSYVDFVAGDNRKNRLLSILSHHRETVWKSKYEEEKRKNESELSWSASAVYFTDEFVTSKLKLPDETTEED